MGVGKFSRGSHGYGARGDAVQYSNHAYLAYYKYQCPLPIWVLSFRYVSPFRLYSINHAGQHSDARGFLPPRIPVPLPTRSAKEEVQWHHGTASTVTHSPQDVPRARQMGGSISKHFVPHTLPHDMAQPSVGPACELLNELAGYE